MKRSRALPTIALAGLIAGILDITSAFVIAGIKGTGSLRMLQGIASGLLGQRSFEGGMATAGLGLAIHFLIAFTAAAVFYAASRKFSSLTEHAVLSGLLYGIAVYIFMYWIVVPLAFPTARPFHVERRHCCDHSHCLDRAADLAGSPPFFGRKIG
jgi:hypothetical protein